MATEQTVPGWPAQPIILEINTWVWLDERSRAHRRPVDLGSVEDSDWDDVVLPAVDAVWLMGVWTRSPADSVIARGDPGVRAELDAALADLTDDDVVGSPYSVRGYTVDARLGGNAGLSAARAALAARGVKLLVDYVPNHVARDHAWVTAHPEYLLQATPQRAEAEPDAFIAVDGRVVALGRDPFFPPWTDVVQLNAFSQPLRDATTATLCDIAQMADGVRCDMAMLLLNDVFAQTWGELAGTPPPDDFWSSIITRVKQVAPDFAFVAEAYWDREPQLLAQGFDHCYDKRLYDALIALDAEGVRTHLTADVEHQRRMLRFVENHDEPRAATLLSPTALRTAAVVVATLPGGVLLYEGQAEGRLSRPPVQLARRPPEPPDDQLRAFYRRLLATLDKTGLRDGDWRLVDVAAVPAGLPAHGLVAWSWEHGPAWFLVVVNLSDLGCEGRLRLRWPPPEGDTLVVAEVLDDARYEHSWPDVADQGLYVRLEAHAHHFLQVVHPSI